MNEQGMGRKLAALTCLATAMALVTATVQAAQPVKWGDVRDIQKIRGNHPRLNAEDNFGMSVAGMGDLDGDGIADFAVGARRDDTGATGAGAVYIFFGNADGTVRGFRKISKTDIPDLSANDNFGWSVAAIGDLDGDGVPDLVAGAPLDDDNGSNSGAVYVLFMNADGTLKGYQKISPLAGNGPTLGAGHWFGASVTAIGDLNGDGIPDLAVGAARDSGTSPTRYGSVYVLFMDTDGTVKSHQKIESGVGNAPTLADLDNFGWSVAAIGDLDGDGVPDLAVGAYGDDTGGTDRGAVYVLFMNANGTVKSYQKIASGTGGGPTLADSDQFGTSVATIGDLDGDGVPDLVVGAPGDDTGSSNRGATYVLFMNANGTVKSYRKIASGTDERGPTLATSDLFGSSAGRLGDMDGDGVPDLVVGAWGVDDGANNAGAAFVLLMNADGTVKEHRRISQTTGSGPCLNDFDYFGVAVAGIGDLDGDGVADLAVGLHGDDDGASMAGAVYVLFMNADGTVKSHQKISSTAGNGPALVKDDYFGRSVAGIGDLDGDGVPDLVVGAFGDDDGASAAGAVYVLFMNADGTVKSHQKISSTAGNGPVLAAGDQFGFSVAGMGDLDGDGIVDLVVGAVGDDDGANNAGAVYVLFMNANGTVKGHQKISSTAGNGPTLNATDLFGYGVAGIGDLDGDGFPDLAVGTPYDDDGLSNAGAVYVLFMNANGTVKSSQKISRLTVSGLDLQAGGLFGGSVAAIGDLNRDGVADLAVGAWRDNDGATDAGAVYVLFMNASGTVKGHQKISRLSENGPALNEGDRFGIGVAGIGDLDGDGAVDLAVGASLDDDGGLDAGAVYVLLMFKPPQGTVLMIR